MIASVAAAALLIGQFNLTETRAFMVMVSLLSKGTRGQGKTLPLAHSRFPCLCLFFASPSLLSPWVVMEMKALRETPIIEAVVELAVQWEGVYSEMERCMHSQAGSAVEQKGGGGAGGERGRETSRRRIVRGPGGEQRGARPHVFWSRFQQTAHFRALHHRLPGSVSVVFETHCCSTTFLWRTAK